MLTRCPEKTLLEPRLQEGEIHILLTIPQSIGNTTKAKAIRPISIFRDLTPFVAL